ncbi:MAG: hypothetical protein GC154_18730 [bacterium]|nr:hypothetical protein [bacterium]
MSEPSDKSYDHQQKYPFRITLMTLNAICFGGCCVLLILGKPNGPLVLLTIATGLSTFANLVGACLEAR